MEGDLKLLGVWGSRGGPCFEGHTLISTSRRTSPSRVPSSSSSSSTPVHKQVPVLVHHGKPIPESLIIIDYIDANWTGNPVLPLHPYDRAMARFWARYVDEKCAPAVWRALWSEPGEEREKAFAEANEVLGKLEAHLKEGDEKFFGGGSVGYVNIVSSTPAHWLVLIGEEVTGVPVLTEEKFPALWEWVENLRRSPIVMPLLPDKDKLVAHFKAKLAAKPSS